MCFALQTFSNERENGWKGTRGKGKGFMSLKLLNYVIQDYVIQGEDRLVKLPTQTVFCI